VATTLYPLICEKLGVSEPTELVKWFYDQELSRNRVADLASLVETASADGDEAAETLIDQAAKHLASAARAVANHLKFPDRYPVVLAGGAFKACPSLYPRVETLLDDLPRAEVLLLDVEPAVGAVTLALELLK